MENPKTKIPPALLNFFRIVCYLCGSYFFLMGLLLLLFPQMATKSAGEQNPMILGILRGTGGSVMISFIWYILIAHKPMERRLIAFVIAFANVVAVVLDLITVAIGEYSLSKAMIDIPAELLSFFTIMGFYYMLHRLKLQGR
jgi:predicted permease